jgi:ATP-dependent Lon protease
MKVRGVGLDHVCRMAYKIRTTTYLLAFEKCKNPQFRVNYFLFSKLINPRIKSGEIKDRLASPEDFREFKESLQEEYRRKYGYKPFEVKASVLVEPERFSPKSIYRELQLLINTFIMTYGLEEKRLTEKMEKELQIKVKEILRSTLMREAVRIIEPEVIDSLENIKKLKEYAKKSKRKRLSFYVRSGSIEDKELNKLKKVFTTLKSLSTTLCYVFQRFRLN